MNNEYRTSKQEDSLPVIEAQYRKNYGGEYLVYGSKLACYTKKQMKSLYPKKNFIKTAEYSSAEKSNPISKLKYRKINIPLTEYGVHSRWLYREKGFVATKKDEDSYIVLLKNTVMPRIAVLLTCLALIIVGTVLALNAKNSEPNTVAIFEDEAIGQANMPELEESAVDWEGVQTNNTDGVSRGIDIPGFKSIAINADSTEVKVNLHNPENNPCYFVISIILDDGTVLYKSKMIEPGKGVYNISLTKPLESGEYDAKVKYETYDLENLGPMNGASVKFTFIVR